jgi:hypothetical protein
MSNLIWLGIGVITVIIVFGFVIYLGKKIINKPIPDEESAPDEERDCCACGNCIECNCKEQEIETSYSFHNEFIKFAANAKDNGIEIRQIMVNTVVPLVKELGYEDVKYPIRSFSLFVSDNHTIKITETVG